MTKRNPANNPRFCSTCGEEHDPNIKDCLDWLLPQLYYFRTNRNDWMFRAEKAEADLLALRAYVNPLPECGCACSACGYLRRKQEETSRAIRAELEVKS
jgi:hypothetical protein